MSQMPIAISRTNRFAFLEIMQTDAKWYVTSLITS